MYIGHFAALPPACVHGDAIESCSEGDIRQACRRSKMASTHLTTCSASTRSSTKPEARHRTGPASPMRQSTPARCAAKSCELTALTRVNATAAVNTTVRSIVTNTCAPALVYFYRVAEATAGRRYSASSPDAIWGSYAILFGRCEERLS